MLLPIVRHICLNTGVEPVKWTPARSRWASTVSPTVAGWPGTKLMTPGGRPAACSSSMITEPDSTAVEAGFHTTVLPHSAGAVGRLPAIEVKLNGVTANTKPSSGRYSTRFHVPGAEIG